MDVRRTQESCDIPNFLFQSGLKKSLCCFASLKKSFFMFLKATACQQQLLRASGSQRASAVEPQHPSYEAPIRKVVSWSGTNQSPPCRALPHLQHCIKLVCSVSRCNYWELKNGFRAKKLSYRHQVHGLRVSTLYRRDACWQVNN